MWDNAVGNRPDDDLAFKIWGWDDTPVDNNPPNPNPSTWSSEPYAEGPNSISMTATQASDPEGNGVEYYFDETTGNSGGSNSGWQSSRSYTDSGLSPGISYTYRVKTRDMSPNQNEGSYSSSETATTPGDNDPPVAYIDSISPNPALEGESVSFSGHGENGNIVGYNWRSNKDGQLSTESSFSMSSLSVNTHNIYFKVQNDEGEWSSEVVESLTIEEESNDPNDTPDWAVGNEWIYDFNFDFAYSILDISGAINNMKLKVTNIDETNDEITVTITGYIDAYLSILDIIPGGSFTGNVQGIGHFEKSTLAIKDFDFQCFGHYTFLETIADVSMTFDPPFDFFDFPIEPDEDENNPWPAETYATLNGNFKIGGLIEYPFTTEGGFEGEELYFEKMEQLTVNSQTFNCYLIRGNMGPSHGGSSKLWYSSDVGFFVDIQETIYNWEGADATLSMPLISTNYIQENDPPNKPGKPTGDTNIIAGEENTYTGVTTDEQDDNIFYKFDWGDGTFSDWLGPYSSGQTASDSHVWVQTGAYNVRVKAKDTNDVESLYSDSLSISVSTEFPIVTFNIYELIRSDDEIDYTWPWDLEGYRAEWYYRVEALSDGLTSTDFYYSTHDHTWYGRWISGDLWRPNKDHELLVNSAEVVLTIKLMDHDDWYELGHDLADVSGCTGDGGDNIADTNPRGAIYHGTYNLATNTLLPYDEDPAMFCDYWKLQNGRYKTSGEFEPDNSGNYDGNDAIVRYWITDTYNPPEANINDPPQQARLTEEIQFNGGVTGGISTDEKPYSWHWDFGDGDTSNIQNPKHTYTSLDEYTITLTVTDGFDQTDSYETTIEIVDNQEPNQPSRPDGELNGDTKKTYTYTSIATDPEGDQIYYFFDWDDGSTSEWVGPYESGEMGSASHKWSNKDTYDIRVKAKDKNFEDVSVWSDPLSVSMPKNKAFNRPFITLLQNFLQKYPNIFPFLRLLLQGFN